MYFVSFLFSPELSGMMTLDEQVVVSNRRCQEILTYDRSRLNPSLRTAEVLLVLTT